MPKINTFNYLAAVIIDQTIDTLSIDYAVALLRLGCLTSVNQLKSDLGTALCSDLCDVTALLFTSSLFENFVIIYKCNNRCGRQ